MSLVVIGLSHRSSPVGVRERFAFAEARIPGTLHSLRESGLADEAVILSTCNRVEVYGRGGGEAMAAAKGALLIGLAVVIGVVLLQQVDKSKSAAAPATTTTKPIVSGILAIAVRR